MKLFTVLFFVAIFSFPNIGHSQKACSNLFTHVNSQAEFLVQKNIQQFQTLWPSIGFKNRKDFLNTVAAIQEPYFRELVDFVKKEKVEIVIHRASRNRDRIFADGFKNIHERGSSRGLVDLNKRNEVEATLLGLPIVEYEKIEASHKPKFAYIRPKKNSKYSPKLAISATDFYGDDGWVFDIQKIKNRMTWTPFDSLNQYNSQWNTRERQGRPQEKNWENRALPWSERLLMTYYLNYTSHPTIGLEEDGLKGFNPNLPYHQAPYSAPLKIRASLENRPSAYMEAQIWGLLTISDVRAFEYRNTKPSDEFLERLKKLGIEIRDLRDLKTSNKDYLIQTKAFEEP